MQLGRHDNFQWLNSRKAVLQDFLVRCPQVVVGKIVLITSFDGARLKLSAQELESGWHYHHGHALSPRISNLEAVPYDSFSEWYILNSPEETEVKEVFVNHQGFGLSNGRIRFQRQSKVLEDIEMRFWRQLGILKPLAYLANGDNLVFATTDDQLMEAAVLAIQDCESISRRGLGLASEY